MGLRVYKSATNRISAKGKYLIYALNNNGNAKYKYFKTKSQAEAFVKSAKKSGKYYNKSLRIQKLV